MKKKFRFSLLLGAVAMMLSAVTMTSCGGDNDDPKPPTSKYEMVDLGLPSGTKWAAYNVGATKPEEIGFYFAFGETKPKTSFTWADYLDGAMSRDSDKGTDKDPLKAFAGKSIAGTQYDAATANWGAGYTMPTLDQLLELMDNTTTELAVVGGVNGCKVISKINGKSIFIPNSGLMEGKTLKSNLVAYFLTASMDGYCYQYFGCSGVEGSLDCRWAMTDSRSWGAVVRAVSK